MSSTELEAAASSAPSPVSAASSGGGVTQAVTAPATLEKTFPAPTPSEMAIIKFPFNPEKITVSHSYKTEGATGTSLDEQIKNLGFVEIGIDKLYIVGETTKAICDTLLSWTNPVKPAVVSEKGEQQGVQPVLLNFTWGTGLTYQVSMRSVTVSYTRFNGTTGKPIRAEVTLKLYQNLNKVLPLTNPTSGGPAGRSSRVLDSSDCLPSIAAATYGRPGAWRRIARANGIDDPLRVPPGTLLYLPEPGDAVGGATR
jgi:nucleoid-associated protein YgaU